MNVEGPVDDLAALAHEVGDFEPPRRLRGWVALVLLGVNLLVATAMPRGEVRHLDGTVEAGSLALALTATLITFLVSLPILSALIALPVAAVRRRGGAYWSRFRGLWLSLLLVLYGLWTVVALIGLASAYGPA